MEVSAHRAFQMLKSLAYVRLSGSEAEKKAANVIKDACTEAGVDVHIEEFTVATGKVNHAKLVVTEPYHKEYAVSGFERARFLDPYAGGKGNSIRYMAVTERDQYLKVKGVENLFCGGEKAGPFIGHTEAIVTGSLAGYNAGCQACGRELLALSGETTAIGAFLNYEKPGGGMFTFAGDAFFDEMQARGLYTTDKETIRRRMETTGLDGIYNTFL